MEINSLDSGVKASLNGKSSVAPYYAAYTRIDKEVQYMGVFERSSSIRELNENDRLIGEYSVDNLGHPLFHPFELRGKWYALYNTYDEYIELMELPSCKKIGEDTEGFCPIDFWVPPLFYYETLHQSPECPQNKNFAKQCTCGIVHRHGCPEANAGCPWRTHGCICLEEWEAFKKERHVYRLPERVHGFVAGCYWGGNFTMHYLDLSRADEGIIIRDERFGEIEPKYGFPLRDAVSLECNAEGKFIYVKIAHVQAFRLQKE